MRLAQGVLDETFLVISGDALCDVDLGSLVEAHRAKGAAVVEAKSVDNPLEFGIVVTDEDGRVERFLEKPSWGQVFSDTINTGIYVLEPEVLRHVPDDRRTTSRRSSSRCCSRWAPIYGHVLDGYWQDIGNLDQFRQANFDALDGRVQLEVPGLRLRGNVWVSEEVDIDQLEPVDGPAFIGPNCRIADGASIGPYSVLSQGVIVRDARVRSVIDVGTYSAAAPSSRARFSAAAATSATTCACTRAWRSATRSRSARRRDLPGRPRLPVQGDRDRRPDPREHRLGDAGGDAVRPRRRDRPRERRPDAGDRPVRRALGTSSAAATASSRAATPPTRADGPARADRGPDLDRRPCGRPAHLAGRGDAARCKTQAMQAGPRRPLEHRTRR